MSKENLPHVVTYLDYHFKTITLASGYFAYAVFGFKTALVELSIIILTAFDFDVDQILTA